MNLYKIENSKSYMKIFTVFSLFAALFMLPELSAFADGSGSGSNDAISQVLCNVIKQFNGPIGKGIATIAIIVLGVGLFLGKLSWAVAVATAIGIGMIFGAGSIVGWIAGSGVQDTGGTASTNTCSDATQYIKYIQQYFSNIA